MLTRERTSIAKGINKQFNSTNNMKKILVRFGVVLCCFFDISMQITAQNHVPILLKRDTLFVDGKTIYQITYRCDEGCSLFKYRDTVSPRIEQVLYADSAIHSRTFWNNSTDSWANIDYNRDGSISALCFLIEYKGVRYLCPLLISYFENGDVISSLRIQDKRGHIVIEYTCFNGKWEWTPHHNAKPPKYAKKLFRIFLSQYEHKLNMLDNCIWFEP